MSGLRQLKGKRLACALCAAMLPLLVGWSTGWQGIWLAIAMSLALVAIVLLTFAKMTALDLGSRSVREDLSSANGEAADFRQTFTRDLELLTRNIIEAAQVAELERTNLGRTAWAVADLRDELARVLGSLEAFGSTLEGERANLGLVASGLDALRNELQTQCEQVEEQRGNLGLVAGGLDELRRSGQGLDIAVGRYTNLAESMVDLARRIDAIGEDLYELQQLDLGAKTLALGDNLKEHQLDLSERLESLDKFLLALRNENGAATEDMSRQLRLLECHTGLDGSAADRADRALPAPSRPKTLEQRVVAAESQIDALDDELRGQMHLLSDRVLAQSASLEDLVRSNMNGDAARTTPQ